MRKWQRYTQEVKDRAVEQLKGCTNVEALACELNVSRGILYQWKDKRDGRPPASKRPGPVVDSPADRPLAPAPGRCLRRAVQPRREPHPHLECGQDRACLGSRCGPLQSLNTTLSLRK
jgi:transposase-like protein